jgi:hypothetical protein
VIEVLDRHVKGVPLCIEVSNYRLETPVPILIDNVAAITVREKFWVEPGVIGPGFWVRANAIQLKVELGLSVGTGVRLVHVPTIS